MQTKKQFGLPEIYLDENVFHCLDLGMYSHDPTRIMEVESFVASTKKIKTARTNTSSQVCLPCWWKVKNSGIELEMMLLKKSLFI